MSKSPIVDHKSGLEIAIVGMSGRFPGAKNVEEFWRNLRDGLESITFFTEEELERSGIDPVFLRNPDYVKAKGVVKDAEFFDASFFGFTPREAETMDPQHRLFLECAWEALESAGYDPERYEGLIGVYGGVGPNSYFLNNLYRNHDLRGAIGDFQIMLRNGNDFLTTRVSYKLNLRGPSVVVQTGCSTSLVAVHQACQSLLSGECDIALAGASSISAPLKGGYLYQNGGIDSPDGHCRAFDAKAQGTVFSNGVGVVALKRLEEAVADGDCILGVIKGAAINNDGSLKVGYTAPSVDGQAEAIRAAQIMAEIQPETITYIETHGTGTALGDPIEMAALTKAFCKGTEKKGFCAIGSAKTNIGHTDVAAGIAGLIKTVLMLKNRMIPPSLYFERPNPEIDFANSPFFVNTKLCEWKVDKFPRRAGVSSFGIGGTNAHVLVEEGPDAEPSGPSRPRQLLLLSAKTKSALDTATVNLREYLIQNPAVSIADVAFTLQKGRKTFSHRRFILCDSSTEAVQTLKSLDPQRVKTRHVESGDPEIVFMFPGQGAQYVNMGLNLYRHETLFREIVDQCAEILAPHLGRDLRGLLYPEGTDLESAAKLLSRTGFQQPAIFTIEFALAKLWEKWGVRPAAMIGHSIGEYAAACLSEVFSLEDALMLVANRGRMMQELPEGAMLSIRLPAKEIVAQINGRLSVAAINAPSLCVVSGPTDEVQSFQRELEKKGAMCRFLHTSHAFHSSIMDSIVKPFEERVRTVRLSPPKTPFVSTATGTWILADQAIDPAYWARQLRETVLFAEGIERLWEKPERVLLEVGPRATCATLARQQAKDVSKQTVISSLADTADGEAEWMAMLNALGQLWFSGMQVNWEGFYEHERRRRVALPTYPFERGRFWVEAAPANSGFGLRAHEVGAEPGKEKATAEMGTSDTRKAGIDSPVLRLKRSLEEASGSDLAGVSDDTTFLEMGFDSLFLTQWALTLKKEYGVPLPVHRLLDDLATFNSLAKYILEESPAKSSLCMGLTGIASEKYAAPGSSRTLEEPQPETPVEVSESGAGSPAIEKLITKQLLVISEVLSDLGKTEVSTGLQKIVRSIGLGRKVAGQEGEESGDNPKEIIRLEPVIERKKIEATNQAPIEIVPRTGGPPLSSGQQRLWYLGQLESNSPVYNLPEAFRLRGNLDTGALERALNEIIRRHEVLRTTYHMEDRGPVQRISPSLQLEVPIIDLSNQPENDREVALARYLESEAWRPFDLAAGPLIRASIVKLRDQEHVLFFMPHHSVFDGWSWSIFQGELFRLYDAFVAGKPSPLPDLPIQYADFGCWQREWLKGKGVEAHLAYWGNKLGGELPVLEMPTDFPRPVSQPIRGSRERLKISKPVVDALTELGRSEGATFFMVILAAFKILLSRYSGQEDIIVASPIAGRTRPETADLIGFFVNTLVFRTDLGGNLAFRELLHRVREVALGAYTHQELPFERLVEEIQPDRDLSRTPVYQAQLIFTTRMMQEKGGMDGILWQPQRIPSKVAQTDITLWVAEAEDGLDLELEYYTDLFKAGTIKRMLKHFEVVCREILANPDRGTGDFSLLTEEEVKQLAEWNATQADYPRDACIHELFESQAERTPERVAVVYEGSRLTYGELNHRATQLAHYLRKLGVGPEVLVGIFVDRSLDMMVGLLGILKAGGAYLPLDPSFPSDRLTFMLEDARVPVLLTLERHLGTMPAYNGQVICLDRDWGKVTQGGTERSVSGVNSGNLAYVIYTSGSTGKPKGVQISHRAVVNFLFSMLKEPGLSEEDILLSVTTLSFDIAALELFLPLITGAQTVLMSRETASDGVQLLERLMASRATVMQATPITWRLLLEAGWDKKIPLKILCGGEALPRELASQLLERGDSLWNMYGPTETTIWSAVYRVESKQGPILIGSPIANTQIYIMDRNLHPLPIGVAGELYIGGEGLARGYLHRPELTRERFIKNPFRDDPGSRLYKTGDLARFLPEGKIEVLGREDHQVKVRGFRVELGEIETLLEQHATVGQAVVVASQAPTGESRLVAYLAPNNGRAPSMTVLREYLREKLPEYMVPNAFVLLEKFPLTPNGKVDRRSLPSPNSSLQPPEAAYLAPRTNIEATLTKIWQEVLRLERIGVNDSFFDLGGTSLSSAILIAKINQAFKVKLPMNVIFQERTVSRLASLVEKTKADHAESPLSQKTRGERNDGIRSIG